MSCIRRFFLCITVWGRCVMVIRTKDFVPFVIIIIFSTIFSFLCSILPIIVYRFVLFLFCPSWIYVIWLPLWYLAMESILQMMFVSSSNHVTSKVKAGKWLKKINCSFEVHTIIQETDFALVPDNHHITPLRYKHYQKTYVVM